jgi:hypothetical protein
MEFEPLRLFRVVWKAITIVVQEHGVIFPNPFKMFNFQFGLFDVRFWPNCVGANVHATSFRNFLQW